MTSLMGRVEEMEVWITEIVKGIGRFFFNPLFYWFFFIVFLASIARIKKERKMFGSKIYDVFDEIRFTWGSALLFGFILSIIAFGLGVTFSYSMVGVLALLTILLSITRSFMRLSPAYTFGLAYLLLLLAPYYEDYLPFNISMELTNLQWVIFTTAMGIFLLYEAYFISRMHNDASYPERMQGSRGKVIGQHRIKKASLIPIVTLLPLGDLTSFMDWWPIIPLGNDEFGLICFPIVIGFEHYVRGMIPYKALQGYAQSLLILGFVVVGVAITGYYLPILTLISVVIALVGRETLSFRFRMNDRQKNPYFTPQAEGMMVLGVIPGTPAQEIGLLAGEKIMKVNARPVNSEQEFYEALQANRTYCKLDVLDERGEIRFVQRAMYQGEHHELGVLFCDQYAFYGEKVKSE